jgi:hypothetical protein
MYVYNSLCVNIIHFVVIPTKPTVSVRPSLYCWSSTSTTTGTSNELLFPAKNSSQIL